MQPNAAPEWQSSGLSWRSREMKEDCPLEGHVRQDYHRSSQSQSVKYSATDHYAILSMIAKTKDEVHQARQLIIPKY